MIYLNVLIYDIVKQGEMVPYRLADGTLDHIISSGPQTAFEQWEVLLGPDGLGLGKLVSYDPMTNASYIARTSGETLPVAALAAMRYSAQTGLDTAIVPRQPLIHHPDNDYSRIRIGPSVLVALVKPMSGLLPNISPEDLELALAADVAYSGLPEIS